MHGYIYVLMAAALWGMIGPVSKLAFAGGATPLAVAFWRAVLAWMLFGCHALATGQVRVARKDLPMFLLFGVLGVSLFYGSYQLAVKSAGAALAAVLLYTAPAWVAVMSRVVLGEPLTHGKLLSILLTMLGVVGVAYGRQGGGDGLAVTPLGIVCGLTAGLTYALYYIFGKHYLKRYTTPTIFLYALPVGALGLLPFAEFSVYPASGWAALAVLALFSTYGAYSVYYIGLKKVEASRAAVVATLEPVIAAVLAFIWWGERFTLPGYLGAGLVLSGVLVLVAEESARRSGSLGIRPKRKSE